MFLASLLGAGLVYAANGGPSAADKKQLGLFSGNGDFIGTVIEAHPGAPSFLEPAGIHYTSYISGLDAIVNIYEESGHVFMPIDISNSPFSLYFDGINCTGAAFFENTSGYFASFQPQVMFSNSVAGRYFVVTSQPAGMIVSQSFIDNAGACTNTMQTIDIAKTVKEVDLPFTLTWPLEVRPI